ncbi:MAG TPA: HIT family protein [Candidatus Paceibacterota bacterium]|nr:HIT family protein [Candidatus Paceibacterota bacterium]
MVDCVYCTLPEIKARMIKSNGLAWAFLTNIPITPGHTLVAPVRHVQKFKELTDDEKAAIFKLMEEVKGALGELFGAEGFHHAWNEERIAGQSIPHFHLHIVPRKQGDEGITEYEPRKFLYRPGSRETTPEAELQDISKQITAKLK